MLVDKVHGLNSTGISLNDRFTILATAAPDRVPEKPRPRRHYVPNVDDLFNQNLSNRQTHLIQQLARRLEQQARRLSIRQRLGVPQGSLRRFGSETSLPGLQRANSFSNLSQNSVRNRVSWRRSNGNLSRSASFNNLSGGWRKPMRGFKRRGFNRNLHGHFRGNNGWFSNNTGFNRQGASMRGRGRAGQRRGPMQQRGRGKFYNQNQKQNPVPTKEELDSQLDQYMSNTKSALDRELDQYMKDAMDIENSFV